MRLIGAILLTSAAHAQMLDFGARPARPDSNVAAEALRASLDEEIAAHPQRNDRDLAKQSIRRLARSLVQRGLDAGARGADHLLRAHTIALNLNAIDDVLDDRSLVNDVEIALLLHDLDINDRDLPAAEADLDELLRDVFAQILVDVGPGDPWLAPPAVRPEDAFTDEWLDQLVARGVTEDAAAAALAVRDDLRAALAWPSYADEASRIVRAAEGAARTLEPHDWMPPVSRDAMARNLDATLKLLIDEERRAGAVRTLERMRAAADAFALADQLPRSAHSRQVQESLVRLASSSNADRAEPRRRIDDFLRVARVLVEGRERPDEAAIVRPFRPIYRVAVAEADRTGALLIRSLTPIIERDDALADPGVLAGVAAHRQAVADVRAVVTASQAFQDPSLGQREPVLRVDRRQLADDLMRTMRAGDDADLAIALMRELAAQIERYSEFPGEAALRDAVRLANLGALSGAPQIWADATGFRQNQILAQIDASRQAWWTEWSRDFALGDHPTTFHTLDAQRLLVETIYWTQLVNAAAYASSPTGAVETPLQAWPAFETSAGALRAIAPSPDAFAEAARLIVADRPGDAMDSIRAIVEASPAFVLIARLEIEAAELAITRSIMHEIGAGPPAPAWCLDQPWLIDQRGGLADFCRYAEELAALQALGEAGRADVVRRYVNDVARLILDQID